MLLVIIIFVLGIFCTKFELNVHASDLISWAQNICLIYTPKSQFLEYYQAIVCGEGHFENRLHLDLLKKSGLYHLIVVSGSHLVFLSFILEPLLRFFKIKKIFLYFLLLSFGIMTGLQAPVLRSLISFLFTEINEYKKLSWTSSEIILASVLATVFLNHSWTNSFSLLLTYCVSLSLLIFRDSQRVYKCFFIYLFTLPFLINFGAPSPTTAVFNLTLSSLVGFILFPVSILSFLSSFFLPLSDLMWELFFNTLSLFVLQDPLDSLQIPLVYLWSILFLINTIMILRRI